MTKGSVPFKAEPLYVAYRRSNSDNSDIVLVHFSNFEVRGELIMSKQQFEIAKDRGDGKTFKVTCYL
jgi:hypothetical protein